MLAHALYLHEWLGWPFIKCLRIAFRATLPGKYSVPLTMSEDSRQDVPDDLHAAEDGRRVA